MCWYCGSPVTDEIIGRSLRCQDCGKDIRCCRSCRFFLSGARGDCKEANAEMQSDKERANFCDWFSLDEKFRGKTTGQKSDIDKNDASKKAFDSLFK